LVLWLWIWDNKRLLQRNKIPFFTLQDFIHSILRCDPADQQVCLVISRNQGFLRSLGPSPRDAYERRLVEGGFCDGFWVDGAVGKGEVEE